MLDHFGLTVKDVEASRAFYAAALAPLGIGVVAAFEGHVGLGGGGRAQFWFSQGEQTPARLHLAFEAHSRAEVDAFYAAALAAGATDNGPPGLRPHTHPTYYGAFAIDPNGHNIEAVCRSPEP